jgi:hypothetical protein
VESRRTLWSPTRPTALITTRLGAIRPADRSMGRPSGAGSVRRNPSVISRCANIEMRAGDGFDTALGEEAVLGRVDGLGIGRNRRDPLHASYDADHGSAPARRRTGIVSSRCRFDARERIVDATWRQPYIAAIDNAGNRKER